MDATMSGCGKPKEFSIILVVARFLRCFSVLSTDSVDDRADWKVHCPAAKIGTKFFKVFLLQHFVTQKIPA